MRDEGPRLRLELGVEEARSLYLALRGAIPSGDARLSLAFKRLEDFLYSSMSIEDMEILVSRAESGADADGRPSGGLRGAAKR
jgi:hypothetical protein